MIYKMNNMKRLSLAFTALVFCGIIVAQTASDSVYVFLDDMADAGIYLPAPPDTASPLFAADFLTWQYGKTIRPTARGKQASDESAFGAEEMCRVYSEAMGLHLSFRTTPAICRFLLKNTMDGHFATVKAKEKYMRKRPFAQMNEHTWGQYDDEAFLRTNGSYPSGHTATGWATALAAVEIAPELQDTILRRGFQYGESRWIVGAHWRSDVEAGYLCASASIARCHANPLYYQELEAARAEYRLLKGYTSNLLPSMDSIGVPDGLRILEKPVDSASYRYYGDIVATYLAMSASTPAQKAQAVAGGPVDTKALMAYFSPALPKNIDKKHNPELFALLDYAIMNLSKSSRSIKRRHFRLRPYLQLGVPSLIPGDEEVLRKSSSYPSGHSSRGWGVALILTELYPDSQNAILSTGYEFGYNRVVAGYHYASDVQAGRLVASYTIARLHSDPEFMRLLELARLEVAKKH